MDIDDEEEENDYVNGDFYYPSVSSFFQYETEFNIITKGSSKTEVHKAKCDEIMKTHSLSGDFSDLCQKVAKYLLYIKHNDDTENRCRCLNYLLNTKTEFNTFSNKKCSELFRAYYAISDKLETCKSTISCIYEEDLEKIKRIYYLNEAMNKLNKSTKDKDEHINSNAKIFAQHYRNAITDCRTDKSEGYCTQLKEIEQYIYQCLESEKYKEAWKILKTLIPNYGTPSITVSFIMILGTPLILYILHKFTPFGPWINTQIQKKKNIWNNLPENAPEIHGYRHPILDMSNSKYNIEYYSIENS
ncbi:PIR Superfamily Protein [Plasmodium ovale wallikeri]|uniref:PIR Superfamily Protein n=1 Tax=Plasmodium ovale wallikeri TaxID=864142 RepID=A0A1A9AQJ1_PLAOA|nr:PIR Superfamily Protein [Plasmodium ovale wallikeri]